MGQVGLTQPRMGEEPLGGLENLGMAGTGPQPIGMLPEQALSQFGILSQHLLESERGFWLL